MPELAATRSAALFCLLVPWTLFGVPAQVDAPSQAESLHAAVRTGRIEAVKELLAKGADVNARDRLGSTPLLDAVWNGNAPLVELLIAKGADVNAVHLEAGSTALEYAVLISRADLVSRLLAAHADLHHKHRSGQSIVHIAAGRGNAPVLELLAAAGADVHATDANANSPLDEAVAHNRLEAVRFLIGKGLSASKRSEVDGRGPLHEACVKGYADLIPVLVSAGADPEAGDHSGQSPLDLALAYKNVSAVKMLLDSGNGDVRRTLQSAGKAMESATMRGQVEIVRLLLASGLDVNRATPNGTTYLHDAALKGQARVAVALLDAGAKLEARNASGGTPLHDAALGGDVKTITLLLDRGAAIDVTDAESGATPLMLAAALGRNAAVELLIRRGADVRLKDRSGLTALDRAQRADDTETVRLLKNSGRSAGSL